jgi:hypothetical protein
MFISGSAQKRVLQGTREGYSTKNVIGSTTGIPKSEQFKQRGGNRPVKRRKHCIIGDQNSSGLIIQGSHTLENSLGINPEGTTPATNSKSLRHPDFPISFSCLGIPKFISPIRIEAIDGPLRVSGDLSVGGNILGGTSGVQYFTDPTDSTSPETGGVVISGGLGVAKNIFLGSSLDVGVNATIGQDAIIGGSLFVGGVELSSSQLANIQMTGLIHGGALSVASTTTIDITAGSGVIVDSSVPQNAIVFDISWPAISVIISTPNLANTFVYIYIDNTGTVLQSLVEPTAQLRRDGILLGKVFSLNTTTINGINNQPDVFVTSGNKMIDFFRGMGPIVLDGLRISANGTNLLLDITAGNLFQEGINFELDPQAPNTKTFIAQTNITFSMSLRDDITTTATAIDVGNYDTGTGSPVAIPGSTSRATNMRVYLFNSGYISVQYGQEWYGSLGSAHEGILSEQYIVEPLTLSNAVLIGIISCIKGATDLTDPSHALFFSASKFGEIAIGASGAQTTNLQNAYLNSTQPQILLNSTLGALQIRDAATPIGAPLLEVLDSAGATILDISDGTATLNSVIQGTDTTESSSISTGAILTDGGLGVAKKIWTTDLQTVKGVVSGSGGQFVCQNTTQANDFDEGGARFWGGIGCNKNIYAQQSLYGDKIVVNSTLDATSPTTGAMQSKGGLGVAKSIFVGIDLDVAGDTVVGGLLSVNDGAIDINNNDTSTLTFNDSSDGAHSFRIWARSETGTGVGQMGLFDNTNSFTYLRYYAYADTDDSVVRFHVNKEATSTTSASVKFDGGVGVVKNVYIGGDLIVDDLQSASVTTDLQLGSNVTTADVIVGSSQTTGDILLGSSTNTTIIKGDSQVDGASIVTGDLNVSGGFSGGSTDAVTTITLDENDYIVRATGACIISLPTGIAGREYYIIHDGADGDNVQINAFSGNYIDNILTASFSIVHKNDKIKLLCIATSRWIVVNSYSNTITWGVANALSSGSGEMDQWMDNGSVRGWVCPKPGYISRVWQIVDADASYDTWKVMTGTLQWKVEVNGVVAYTGAAYSGILFESAATEYSNTAVLDSGDIGVLVDAGDILVVTYTSASGAGGMELGAQLVITHFT